MTSTADGLGYDRAGPRGATPLLLVHAGVADRRMWDPVWSDLSRDHDVVRVDLRGSGGSDTRPDGPLDPVADVLAVLAAEGLDRVDVVGASFGAGVAVELALTRPQAVRTLLLAAPGGSLLAERTEDFAAFATAEHAALEADDLDAAAAANVRWWVVGPGRDETAVDSAVRDAVHRMQRRTFEVAAAWSARGGEVEETELDPPALERLGDVRAPTTVLLGAHDLLTVQDAAARVVAHVPGARLVEWDDVAHLPYDVIDDAERASMEQPERFVALVREVCG